jgi:alkylation response protein AidB-like acyl-CoA dehydrogenase
MKVTTRYQAISDAASRARGDALVAWLREYGERRINSRLIDERRCIPPYVALDFGNQGLLGIQVEERHGGLGLRSREVARVLEQAAAIDLSLGTFLLVCLFPGVRPLAAFGSDALKQELLPSLAKGRVLAGFAQTEPGAGTNFAAMAARAEAAGGGYRVSGDKVWIGNGTWAGALTVMAQEYDGAGRRKGLVALAVRTEQPGVVLGRELLSMGMRGVVQSEVGFRDVRVAPEFVLGTGERGLEVGVDSMSWSRFAIAATCIGSMKRCLQLAARFGSRRTIATGRVIEHPVIRAWLGEALAMIATAEGLLYRVAEVLDAGAGVPAEILAACKVLGSEFLGRTSDRLVQVLGSRGYDEANEAPQLLRDARVTRIFEGATEPLVAFVGAAALSPRSDLHGFLRGELAAPAAADDLAAAVQALRARKLPGGAALPRPLECALAGWAALWALVRGTAEAALRSSPGAERERTAAWAQRRFAEAAGRAREGGAGELLLQGAGELEKAIAALADGIGDVDQVLPGGRDERDPLLRRETPPGSASGPA